MKLCTSSRSIAIVRTNNQTAPQFWCVLMSGTYFWCVGVGFGAWWLVLGLFWCVRLGFGVGRISGARELGLVRGG